MLEDKYNISELKQSEAADFIAEVFYDELKFILGEELDILLKLKLHGMNARVHSKDVLNISTDYQATRLGYREFLVLHLSRNSMYHQLPEALFHPLVVSRPSMSNREIVEAVRKNRKREKNNLYFFSAFDTQLFKERAHIFSRHLNLLTDEKAKEIFLNIAKQLLNVGLTIPKKKLEILFLELCHSEQLKENLPAIERLLELVLELPLKLCYIPKKLEKLPFIPLGEARIGVNFGLDGSMESEIEDVKVTLFLSKSMDYELYTQHTDNIRKILSFLLLAAREVIFSYEKQQKIDLVIGKGHLGLDTFL